MHDFFEQAGATQRIGRGDDELAVQFDFRFERRDQAAVVETGAHQRPVTDQNPRPVLRLLQGQAV